MINSLLEQFRADIDGQLSDKRRVIDNLLDVRLAAAGLPAVVAEIDRLLADMPGLTTVENTWWTEAIDDIDRASGAVPTG